MTRADIRAEPGSTPATRVPDLSGIGGLVNVATAAYRPRPAG